MEDNAVKSPASENLISREESKAEQEEVQSDPEEKAELQVESSSPKSVVSVELDKSSEKGEAEEPLYVQHECFGMARGAVDTDNYDEPAAKCIKCMECGKLLRQTTRNLLTFVV